MLWCNSNGISKSTLAGWIRSTKSNVRKTKIKTRFIELTISTELQKETNVHTKNIAEIVIEYKSFKISSNIDVRTLENIFKVILHADA